MHAIVKRLKYSCDPLEILEPACRSRSPTAQLLAASPNWSPAAKPRRFGLTQGHYFVDISTLLFVVGGSAEFTGAPKIACGLPYELHTAAQRARAAYAAIRKLY